MKKITLLAFVALAFSFASCKKDYTCECTTTVTGCSSCSGTSTTIIKDVKKSTAKNVCVDMEQKDSQGNVSYTRTCKLSK